MGLIIFFSKNTAYNILCTVALGVIRYKSGGGIKFIRRHWIGKALRFDSLIQGQNLGTIFYFALMPPVSDFFCLFVVKPQDDKMVVFLYFMLYH